MIVVDSSVWIDFLNGRMAPHVERLRATLHLPSLDAVFASLVEEDDSEVRCAEMVAAMHS